MAEDAKTAMSVDEAILAVRDECLNGHARAYASAAMQAAVTYGTHGLKVQVQYMLANMGYWRGPRARKVKAVLRAFVKAAQ